jgi:GNAT superfamily N-acetyltransferase
MIPNIISLHPLHLDGWEDLRHLRNECRDYMTGFRGEVTAEMQDAFRRMFDTERQAIYLIDEGTGPIGFLYMKWEEGAWRPTYGITESERGRGLGRTLVRLSQALVPAMTLEVRRTNEHAIKLYFKSGFVVSDMYPDKLIMKWSRATSVGGQH